ncbi:MAG: TerC family protein [Reyranellaceae bacterium]
MEFLSALFAIVLIDLVLAGDNALVIGLVARELPKEQQKKVIYWGTAGAIVIRAVMAVAVVWLLKIPGFQLAGGIALVWIARQLLSPSSESAEAHAHGARPAKSLAGAVRTIVIADAVMGVDNVLAIGGAAHGSVLLIVLGLAISVPIIVWGSQLVIRLVDRYPAIILLGGAVLAWTAYKMIVAEPLLKDWLAANTHARPAIAILVFAIALAPWYGARLARKHKPLVLLLPALLLWWLGFDAVGELLKVEASYARSGELRDYALQALRWLGWMPFVLAWLAVRERRRVAG